MWLSAFYDWYLTEHNWTLNGENDGFIKLRLQRMENVFSFFVNEINGFVILAFRVPSVSFGIWEFSWILFSSFPVLLVPSAFPGLTPPLVL